VNTRNSTGITLKCEEPTKVPTDSVLARAHHLDHRSQPQIRAFVDGWNDEQAHPFTWTKTADQIFAKAHHPTTSDAGH
jgi:hypothetical protein